MSTASILIAGVDEAGRGPLAGPVVAAAVILDPERPVEGLRDSKLLSPGQRARLAEKIKERALGFALGRAEVAEIDCLNILQASLLAMQRAVTALALILPPEEILIDGNRLPQNLPCPARAIIGGDRTEPAISAASILAKVTRDAQMCLYEEQYPGYEFAIHKGYPTARHRALLQTLGASPIHRCSFAPVRALLSTGKQAEYL